MAAPVQAEPVIPALSQRVTDQANILSPSEQQQLEAKLQAYEESTGHQFAVLTLPSLEGLPVEDFSIRVVEKWKLGDEKRDDGLLLLVALEDRVMRIEVGHGLEGAIPDALAARIIRHQLTPAFREGQFYQGLDAALSSLMKAAEGEAVQVGPKQTESSRNHWHSLIFFLVLLLLFSGRGRGSGVPIILGAGGLGGMGGGRGGGGFGGFSGGGGSFGGGGASGRW